MGASNTLRYPEARLLIFAKAPVPGQVKTRLIPRLGEEGAARLYTRLLRRVVDELGGSGLCPVQCWCAPDTRHPLFKSFQSDRDIALRRQTGADLGERMLRAAADGLNESDAVVLVGGDCPDLGADYLRRALECLYAGADAVLGPAEDGGYVLLGLRQAAPKLFEDMPWGSEQVLPKTRRRLSGLGWRWRELPVLWDLDRPEDLVRLSEQRSQRGVPRVRDGAFETEGLAGVVDIASSAPTE